MANEVVKMFVEEYRPVAEQVSKQIGVDPSVLLAQWAMETDYGRSVPGHFNLGNIKDFSGAGTPAKDRQTKTVDKYINFESPEAFGDYYSHMMRRLYPNTLNTGSDIDKYSAGLMSGKIGAYAEVGPKNYATAIRNFHSGVSSSMLPDATEAERIARQQQSEGKTTTQTAGGDQPKEEGVNPLWGAPAGALATAVGMASDYTEPKPVDVAGARREYGNTMRTLDLERQVAETKAQGEHQIAMQKAQNAVYLAQQEAALAQFRLQERMANPEGFAGGPSLQQLDADFQAAQQKYETARQTLAEATAAAKAKAPVPVATEAAAPQQIITDPNAPMVRTPSEQVYEGTIDPETRATGRQRQGYNEVTSYQALQRSEQEKALQAARQKGLVPDVGESARLAFGAPTSTPAGVLVQSDTGAPIKAQQELENRQAAQQAAEKKMQENLEMERIKNEALLARQKQSEAAEAAKKAREFQQKRVSDLQKAAGTAQTKAEEARLGLPFAQQQAQSDLQLAQRLADLERTKGADAAAAKLAEIEAKVPGTIARLARFPALVGAGMTQPSGVISSSGKLAFGAGAGVYGLMSYNELMDRLKKGDNDPALLRELAAKSGLSAAALVPAVGPWSARIKGAGVLGTVSMAVPDLYHILTNAEKRVSAMEAAEKRLRELRPNP